MFSWRGFPWTNFEELNLDWVLRHIKGIEVDTIPALEKKVDDTYQYITENLGDIVAQLATVIWNVKWSGAAGDGVTDDTAAIAEALTKSNILYFPAGTYCFKEVTCSHPVYMFGDGDSTVWQPIRKEATNNLTHTMLKCEDSAFITGLQIKQAAPLAVESGTKYYIDAAVIAENADEFILYNVTIDRFHENYHISWADPIFIDFESRHGMALYIHECNNVLLKDCHFLDYAGEELIWVSNDRVNFVNGTVTVDGCYFKKTSYGVGSAFNGLGGKITFINNVIDNFNALYDSTPTNGGSALNIDGCYVTFSNNQFINFKGGNYLDFNEGYFVKSEFIKCTNNVFTGSVKDAINEFAKTFIFTDNYIEGSLLVRCRAVNAAFTYTTGGGQTLTLIPYCEDVNTVFTAFDYIDISNNEMIVKAPAWNHALASYDSPISEQSNVYTITYKNIRISGNVIKRESDAIVYGVIYLFFNHDKAIIKDNSIRGAGASSPSYAELGYTFYSIVSGAGTQGNLIFTDNIIDGSDLTGTDGICLVTGTAAFRSGTKYNITFNTCFGGPRIQDHSGAASALGGFNSAYNDGLTARG